MAATVTEIKSKRRRAKLDRPKPEHRLTTVSTDSLVEVATPRQVARVAATMTREFLRCRRLRHAWDDDTVYDQRGTLEAVVRCLRCGSTKSLTYNKRTGAVTERTNIKYAEGYLIEGIGKIDKEGKDILVRQSLLADVTVKVGKVKGRAG